MKTVAEIIAAEREYFNNLNAEKAQAAKTSVLDSVLNAPKGQKSSVVGSAVSRGASAKNYSERRDNTWREDALKRERERAAALAPQQRKESRLRGAISNVKDEIASLPIGDEGKAGLDPLLSKLDTYETRLRNAQGLPSLGERLGSIASGAGKAYAADMGGTLMEGFESSGRAATGYLEGVLADLEVGRAEWEEALGRAKTPEDKEFYQTQLDEINRKIESALEQTRSGFDFQKGTRLFDDMAAEGGSDIERGKAGLGFAGRLLVDTAVAGGQMAADIGIGAVTGGSSMLPMFLRSFGGGERQARLAGADEAQQLLYGLASGALSVGTEKISNVAPLMKKAFGAGLTDDAIEKAAAAAIDKFAKTEAGKQALGRLASIGLSGAGEGLEEIVEGIGSTLAEKLIYNPDAGLDLPGLFYDGLVGFTLGGVTGAGGNVMSQRGAGPQSGKTLDSVIENIGTPKDTPGQDALMAAAGFGKSAPESSADFGDTETTAIDTNPAAHTPAEQRIIEEYQGAVDENLVDFIKRSVENKGTNTGRFILKPVSDRAAAAIKAEIGVDPSGFKTVMEQRMAEHIYDRHGPNGTADQTMADINDIGRIQYVLDNYDSLSDGGHVSAYSTNKPKGRTGQAKSIVFEKAVNGTFYVVEAVPDTKAQTTYIVSAFMSSNGNSKTGALQIADAQNAPTVTSEIGSTTAPATTPNIPQPAGAVNTQYAQNGESANRGYVESFEPPFPNPRGKYQKILNKHELSYDDLLELNAAGKIKGTAGNIVFVSHGGETYMKLTDVEKFRHILEAQAGTGKASAATEGTAAANTQYAQNSPPPGSVGAMRAAFPYKEVPTQSNSTKGMFTDAERNASWGVGDPTHKLYSNAESARDANERLEHDYMEEMDYLASPGASWGAAETVMAHQILSDLTEDARISGDYSEVVKWKRLYDSKGTEEGQALQARRQFSNTPEEMISDAAVLLDSGRARKMSDAKKQGILDNVAKQADALAAVPEGDTGALIDLIKTTSSIRRTTGLFSKESSKQMNWALNTLSRETGDAEQFLRDVAAAQIRNIASDYQKISPLEAVKNFRVMGMLSKIATFLRNIVSNSVFDPLETLSNDMVVPLDILLSKATGTRSIAVDKSWLSKAKRQGSIEGALKSFIQVGLDADVTDTRSKYESGGGRTFKMTGNPIERFLSTWEKMQGYGLQTTDEFAKGGVASEAQRGIDKLKAQGKIAADALPDRAREIALQRTFQNDSRAVRAVIGTKNALNNIGVSDHQGGSLGVGDIGIPFAKIPANIATQAVNYSEAGLVNGIKNVARILHQAKKGTLTPETQAKAVTDIGRGLAGTAGLAIFSGLALKGIISVAGSDDRDKEAFEKNEGKQGTQLNVSALWRWINGNDTGWQSGDDILSIGFLEPLNARMAAAAMIADAYKEDGTINAMDIINADVASTAQAVIDLPAMQLISDLIDGYKYSSSDTTSGKLADTALQYTSSQISSFLVPNIVRGIATGTDDTTRSVRSDNPMQNIMNNILAGIPGARQTLPAALDSFGRDKTQTGSLIQNILNNNILPGQITKFNQEAVGKEIARLAGVLSDNSVYPNRNAPSAVSGYTLTPEEKRAYQTTSGRLNLELMDKLIASEEYAALSDAQRGRVLQSIMDYANDEAKRELVTSRGGEYISADWESKRELPDIGRYLSVKEAFKTASDTRGADSGAFEAVLRGYDSLDAATQAAVSETDGFTAAKDVTDAGIPLQNYYSVKDNYKAFLDSGGTDAGAFEGAKGLYDGLDAKGRELVSGLVDSRFKSMMNAVDSGATLETAFGAWQAYKEISNLDEKQNTKAAQFANWLDNNGVKGATRQTLVDEFKFYNQTPADAAAYESMRGTLGDDKALSVQEAMGRLTPEAGADQVSYYQKFNKIADLPGLSETEKIAVIAAYNKQQYPIFATANQYGINVRTVAAFYNFRRQADEELLFGGSVGSYTNNEINWALDQLGLTQERRRNLWNVIKGNVERVTLE